MQGVSSLPWLVTKVPPPYNKRPPGLCKGVFFFGGAIAPIPFSAPNVTNSANFRRFNYVSVPKSTYIFLAPQKSRKLGGALMNLPAA